LDVTGESDIGQGYLYADSELRIILEQEKEREKQLLTRKK
jgi:hypothetical protein